MIHKLKELPKSYYYRLDPNYHLEDIPDCWKDKGKEVKGNTTNEEDRHLSQGNR